MTKETVNKILKKLNVITDSKFNPYEIEDINEELILENKEYHIVHEELIGGEGEGNLLFMVVSITSDEEKVYIRFDAHYDSWNGADWEGSWDFTRPYEETVIRWT